MSNIPLITKGQGAELIKAVGNVRDGRFRYDHHFEYNAHALAALDAIKGDHRIRKDAANTVFFQRELESFIPTMFEVDLAPINGRSLFPIDRSASPTAESITYRQFQKFGQAEFASAKSKDVPLVNADGQEFTSRVAEIRIGAEWDINEIAASNELGRGLDRMLARAAREAMMRLENDVIFNGSADFDLNGVLIDPNVPTIASVGTGPDFDGNTPEENRVNLHTLANTVVTQSNDLYTADTILIGTSAYNLLIQQKTGTDNFGSVLTEFLAQSPYINQVIPVRELDGAAGARTALAYRRGDPDLVRIAAPLDLQQLAPQVNGFSTYVYWRMRTGGVIIPKPLSLLRMTGV